MKLLTLKEAKKILPDLKPRDVVLFKNDAGVEMMGSIRIREIRCGKKNCHKCPHKSYAYATYREGKKVKTKYIGVVR